MNRFLNSFAVLNIDGDDDLEETTTTTTRSAGQNHASTAEERGKCKKKEECVENGEVAVESVAPRSLDLLTEQFNFPLVWIDLEMTGLDLEVDRILEIACIVTDGNLTKSVEGPNLVIHQTKDCMHKMGEWCQEHHGASGLTKRVLQSSITEAAAEEQVIEFVRKHVGTYKPLLAGNSVHVDYTFLKKYMPNLACLFNHVLVDVSSVKALCFRWFPKDYKKKPAKANNHRALDDIRESIRELKYYKENIFKSRTKK